MQQLHVEPPHAGGFFMGAWMLKVKFKKFELNHQAFLVF